MKHLSGNYKELMRDVLLSVAWESRRVCMCQVGTAQMALPVLSHCLDLQDPAVNRGQPGPGGMILPSSAAHSETKLVF